MNKLYALLLCGALIVTFTSCKKDDDSSTRVPKLTGWRTPDCGNTAGEGMYEAFNDSETVHLITHRYPGAEEQLDTSVVSDISITSRTVSYNGVNTAFFEYKAHQPLRVDLSLLLNNEHQGGYSGQIVDSVTNEKTRFNLVNVNAGGKKGCHRLYYVFTQQLSPAKTRIVNKGHFDIDLQ